MGKRRLVETTCSRSRCVTTSVQAVHCFEVPSFSLLQGMGAGRFVSSRTFHAGGRVWNIRVYPDGYKERKKNKAAYVSASLYFVDGTKDVRTNFTLELLEKDGRVSELINNDYSDDDDDDDDGSYTFKSPGRCLGYRKFLHKSKLKEHLCLNDDCFTIRCVLTVIGESQSENVAVAAMEEQVPEPSMHRHFEHMLKAGKGKDVAFDVDGQLFHAHRCVLAARSSVFAAQLFCPTKEMNATACTEPNKVEDMEPSIFEELLHIIYTDSMPSDHSSKNGDDDENVFMQMQHLLVAADRYGLERLRLMCEVNLCHAIDAQTVATTLALAEQHHCARLKAACLKFVASSRDILGVVKKTEGFKHLVASCPLIAVEILDTIAKA